MDYISDRPRPTQDRLPAGPALTDWLLAELDSAATAAAIPEVWIKVMRAFVLKHRAAPSYVTDGDDPTGPDVRSGWHCQECGLDRDGPNDDWPCEELLMIATAVSGCTRSRRPATRWKWAWTVPEEERKRVPVWHRGA